MKRIYIFRDAAMLASTATKEQALDLIREYQKYEDHPFQRAQFSMIEGKAEEFVSYQANEKDVKSGPETEPAKPERKTDGTDGVAMPTKAKLLNDRLFEKMQAAQEKYRLWLYRKAPKEVLDHAYEYAVREARSEPER